MHITVRGADDVLRGNVTEIAREIIARPHFADQGAIGTGKAIRDEPVIRQRVDKALQPDTVPAIQGANQFDKTGMRDGVGKIHARRDVDRAAIQMRGAHTGIQRMRGIHTAAASRHGDIERLEIGIEEIGIATQFIEGQPPIAVDVFQ